MCQSSLQSHDLLIILNDPPYGTERSYNGLRLAMTLKKAYPDLKVNVFLLGDAGSCAVAGQKTPDGYYNLERMIRAIVTKKVSVICCGTCLDARGLSDDYLVTRVKRSTIGDLGKWTVEADKVVTF
ncbi:MAG: DsrE family protein [Candidatus Thorarchaeota archaeon]|nr:DsrE family protein [Candidatus Thorarchaeota archaeon]